jgi:hypothetical protein
MSSRDEIAPDRYRLISALLTLHEAAPALDEAGVGRRAVELAEEVTKAGAAYLHVVERGGGIRLAVWSDARRSRNARSSRKRITHSTGRHLGGLCARGRPVVHNEAATRSITAAGCRRVIRH